jgi:hypothetical protein
MARAGLAVRQGQQNARRRCRAGLPSPILKFLSDAAVAGILSRTGAANERILIFFGADSRQSRWPADLRSGALRLEGRTGHGPRRRLAGVAAVGGRLPDVVEMDARRQALGRDASPVHRAACR